jgi:hypothetical protein
MPDYELRIFTAWTAGETSVPRTEPLQAVDDDAAIEHLRYFETTLPAGESVYLAPAGSDRSIASGSGVL